MMTAYQEAIEFLAQGMTPQELIAFRTSANASARFQWLIEKAKSEGLPVEEREELERVMKVERVLSMAKARARTKLAQRVA